MPETNTVPKICNMGRVYFYYATLTSYEQSGTTTMVLIMRYKSSNLAFDDVLAQGWANCGPRAACGPRRTFVRPEKVSRK